MIIIAEINEIERKEQAKINQNKKYFFKSNKILNILTRIIQVKT